MQLENAREYYVLKITGEGGIWFKQRINFKSKPSLSQLKERQKDFKMFLLKVNMGKRRQGVTRNKQDQERLDLKPNIFI